jgi:DNA-binding PadR family transcriptional regulator
VQGVAVVSPAVGYLFEVLNALEEKGYISQTRRVKSLASTELGVERAEEIIYLLLA